MNNISIVNEDISLLEFIGKYQYLTMRDAKYICGSSSYYKKRITKLTKIGYIRRLNEHYVLTAKGVQFIKSINLDYQKLIRTESYLPRLFYISNIAAFYYNCPTVKFIRSAEVKDSNCLTTTSRRYIGVLNIDGTRFLTYHIRKKHNKKYIASVIYDIQKEKNYRNILILADDISMININDFTFGYYQVLVVEDNLLNREKLKYFNSVNWPLVVEKEYKRTYPSHYNYCDFLNEKPKYISYFYFVDTEKINRINQFLRGSKEKHADIICPKEVKERLQKIIPRAKYKTVNLDKVIEKERRIYYEF